MYTPGVSISFLLEKPCAIVSIAYLVNYLKPILIYLRSMFCAKSLVVKKLIGSVEE